MSSGSSESSSCSGSDESNNSDSDSEEDHILSEDDVNELKNEITPTKSKASPLEEEESPLSAVSFWNDCNIIKLVPFLILLYAPNCMEVGGVVAFALSACPAVSFLHKWLYF